MIRVFSFLYRHSQSGILYFRYTIPEKYRPAFGRREVKRSLKTTDKAIALPMGMELYCQVQEQIKRIEDGMTSDSDNSQNRCWQYITTKVSTPDGQVVETTFDTGDDDKDYELSKKMQADMDCKVVPVAKPKPVLEKTETLAKVAKLYRNEKITEGSWRPKTHIEHEALHGLLVLILRNKPIESITHADARKFKELLLQLPPNMTKGKFAGKTVRQVVAMKPVITLSVKTANEKLGRASSLFSWAVRQGYTAVNPFEGLKLKDNRTAHEQKDRYTQEELNILFSPRYFSLEKLRAPFMYWIPLIALFSGARLGEIVQLRVVDIQEEDSIPFFEITPDAGPLKNRSAARKVPFHPILIELGFLDHVSRMDGIGHKRVFHEAYGTTNGPVDKVSKWFRNYRRKLQVGELKSGDGRRKLDMHSFRHTFADNLKQQLVDSRAINALVGHTDKDLAAVRYGKPLGVAVMYPHLCKVDFELPGRGSGRSVNGKASHETFRVWT